MRENLKNEHLYLKKEIWSKDILMHEAERPINYFSNTFTHNQAEQIMKRLICVQILLQIHRT